MTSTAAVLYEPEDNDPGKGPVFGRRVADEEFLRALIRYAGFERLTAVVRTSANGEAFLQQAASLGASMPADWVLYEEPARVERVGNLILGGPSMAIHAWQRRRHRQSAYSICGVTHTICSSNAMDSIGSLLVAPLQPWDALVCTSRAGRAVVLEVLDEYAAYLKERFGTDRIGGPQLPVIPLGVDCAAIEPPPAMRARLRSHWRTQLGIAENDVAALMLGRLSHVTKANPLPMYMALGRAAAAAPPGTRVHLILGGQFDGPAAERVFREGAAALCPDVTLHLMDGRMPGFRANAFSAADFFTSLVDNIQETFGLAPVEAMAAGLPVVVSDWDGYRDTVEDGVQGFRVPTLMTVSGSYLASRYTVLAEGNNSYLSGVGQFVAMDVPAAEAAYRTLIADPARRQAMGAAARAHARAKYDWSVVIGQHLELWETLARLRGEAVTSERAPHTAGREPVPLRPNPFAAFASYPTHRLGPDTVLALAEGASTGRAKELAGVPGAVVRGDLLPSWAEMSAVLERLGDGGPTTARALASQAASQPHRQLRLLRGLAWLAKLDLVRRQD